MLGGPLSDITCDKHDSVGGKYYGLLVTLQRTHHLHSPHAASSLVYSPAFCCCPEMKEIKQDAAVLCGSCHADRLTIIIMIM